MIDYWLVIIITKRWERESLLSGSHATKVVCIQVYNIWNIHITSVSKALSPRIKMQMRNFEKKLTSLISTIFKLVKSSGKMKAKELKENVFGSGGVRNSEWEWNKGKLIWFMSFAWILEKVQKPSFAGKITPPEEGRNYNHSLTECPRFAHHKTWAKNPKLVQADLMKISH